MSLMLAMRKNTKAFCFYIIINMKLLHEYYCVVYNFVDLERVIEGKICHGVIAFLVRSILVYQMRRQFCIYVSLENMYFPHAQLFSPSSFRHKSDASFF